MPLTICFDAGHGNWNKNPGQYDPGFVFTQGKDRFEEATIALAYVNKISSSADPHFNNQQSPFINRQSLPAMKRLSVLTLALTLSACTVDWHRAAVAAANASAPIVLDGLNAKQPRKNVQP